MDLTLDALKVKDDYGWIAPHYANAERAVDAIRKTFPRDVITIKGSKPWLGECVNGSRIFFLSAANPEPILGHGFRAAAIDEAASIHKDVWDEVIYPTLGDKMGRAMIFGTPKGRNWFFDEFTRGQDPEEPDYESFTLPTCENPYFPNEAWVKAKKAMPDMKFRQEFMAEFLEDSSGVFHNIMDCARGTGRCSCDEPPVIGCDLAKHQDFTFMIAVCPKCAQCIDMKRFNQIDWSIQRKIIYKFTKEHNGRLTIDSTGVGDPVYDELRAMGMTVRGYSFSGGNKKAQLIQNLMLYIENRTVMWPASWEVLTNELKRYEYKYSALGNVSYNAPSGFHDDGVIALGLATMGLSGFVTPRLATDQDYRDYEAAKYKDETAEEQEARIVESDDVWDIVE